MALTLRARATLDTSSFMAGMNRMAAAQGKLSAATSASVGRELSDNKKLINARKAAAVPVVAAQKATAEAAAKTASSQAAATQATRMNLNAQRYLYADMARMSARAAAGFAAIPVAAAAAGISWQRSFADVVRTADPIVSESIATVENLRLSLRDMVQTMPVGWGDVSEIATLANQMGIASTETASFTRAVAMFSATSNVSVDQTATAFGRLRSIVPEIGSDFMGLADSILKVGVNSVATESEIINIVTQISSIAGAAGMSDKGMVGLAGAMASVRVPPELSRGVITRVFGQISRATAGGGAALEGFAKVAGMSATEFREAWRPGGDTDQAFLSFVEGLQKLGPRAEAELRGLGITSVRDVPVMLRLANAADSDGEVGRLFRQTLNDANRAAGETQRQYSIMADTVAAKLRVVGNNILAFFNEASQNSLGPLGNVLDFVGDKIRDVTNSLDESHKLFGTISMPFTNSELIGTVATLSLVAAGFLAVGSAIMKLRHASVGWQTMMGVLGGRAGTEGVRNATTAWRAFPATVITSMGRAEAAARRGFRSMNQEARRSANIASSYTPAAAATGMSARQAAYARSMVLANRQFEVGARSATARAAASFTQLGQTVSAVGRGMGAAASFAFGPWGIAIGLLTLGLNHLVQESRGVTTEISDLAEDMARFSDSAKGLEAIQNIQVGDLFGYEAQPFKEGYQNLQDMKNAARDLNQELRTPVTAENARGAAAGILAAAVASDVRASKDYREAVKVLDGAFQDMVNSGNGTRAADLLTKFTGSSEELFDLLDSDEASNMRRFYQSAFDMGEETFNAKGLEKLARGDLPEVRAALLGITEAVNVTQTELDEFDGGAEAFSALAKAAEEVASGFISYGDAVAAATDASEGFSMPDFAEELNKQMEAQQQWADNLAKAGQIGGSEFVDALVEMGVDAQEPLQAIVEDFEKTGGDINGDWKGWMDMLIQSTDSSMGVMGVAIAAARDAMLAVLGDVNLMEPFQELSPEDFQVASQAMQAAGTNFSRDIAKGVQDGKYEIEEALGMLVLEQYKVEVDAEMNLEPAQLSLATLVALGNGTITTVQLDALPDLAKNAIWETIELANGETAMVQIDADGNLAMNELSYIDAETGKVRTIQLTGDKVKAINEILAVRDEAASKPAKVNVETNAAAARAAILALQGLETTSNHVISISEIVTRTNAVGPSKTGVMGGQADGSVLSFYADGGINSQHVAQIAPAGAWRVWAEPETEGEAYIPFARSKRTRSVAILDQVAQRFGYSLNNASNVAKFADGGQYMAQTMSRQRFAGTQVASGTGAGGVSIGPVTFTQAQQKDQFREFTRHVRRATRGA